MYELTQLITCVVVYGSAATAASHSTRVPVRPSVRPSFVLCLPGIGSRSEDSTHREGDEQTDYDEPTHVLRTGTVRSVTLGHVHCTSASAELEIELRAAIREGRREY